VRYSNWRAFISTGMGQPYGLRSCHFRPDIRFGFTCAKCAERLTATKWLAKTVMPMARGARICKNLSQVWNCIFGVWQFQYWLRNVWQKSLRPGWGEGGGGVTGSGAVDMALCASVEANITNTSTNLQCSAIMTINIPILALLRSKSRPQTSLKFRNLPKDAAPTSQGAPADAFPI